MDPLMRMTRKPLAWSRLRIHHYFSRSEEERLRKAELWRDAGSHAIGPDGGPARSGRTVRDETLVALRAGGARGAGAPRRC